MKKMLDYTALTQKAREEIIKQQKVSYEMLCRVLETNSKGAIVKVLHKLRRAGVVAQGKGRRWEVLIDANGVKRPRPTPPARKVVRRKRGHATKFAPRPRAAKKRAGAGSGRFTLTEKLHKLTEIADIAGDESEAGKILREIREDLAGLGQAAQLARVLK
jgi:hypothetical protein